LLDLALPPHTRKQNRCSHEDCIFLSLFRTSERIPPARARGVRCLHEDRWFRAAERVPREHFNRCPHLVRDFPDMRCVVANRTIRSAMRIARHGTDACATSIVVSKLPRMSRRNAARHFVHLTQVVHLALCQVSRFANLCVSQVALGELQSARASFASLGFQCAAAGGLHLAVENAL